MFLFCKSNCALLTGDLCLFLCCKPYFLRSTDRLPAAHTCFNQLDLPAYEVIFFTSAVEVNILEKEILYASLLWSMSNLAQFADLRQVAHLPVEGDPGVLWGLWLRLRLTFHDAQWSSDRTYIMIPTVVITRREPIYTRRKEPSFLDFTVWKLFQIAFFANRRLRMYWTL